MSENKNHNSENLLSETQLTILLNLSGDESDRHLEYAERLTDTAAVLYDASLIKKTFTTSPSYTCLFFIFINL